MSLSTRILLVLIPLFVLCLVAADAATYEQEESFLFARVQQQAFEGHIAVETSLGRQFGDRNRPGPPEASQPGTVWGELLSDRDAVLAGPQFLGPAGQTQPSPTANRPVLPSQLIPGDYLAVNGLGEYQRYLVYSELANDNSGDVVVAAVPMSDYDAALGHLLLIEALVGSGVVLVLATVAWAIVRRALRPLVGMSAAADAIAAGALETRVASADNTTEIGRLGLALNTMLDKLAASDQRLRRFLADASHALRTPLTSVRGYAELVRRNPDMDPHDLDTALLHLEVETRRMGTLIDDLSLLSRIDLERLWKSEQVHLTALVAGACADARRADPGRIITLQPADTSSTVTGDEAKLRQAIANLLRNAIVHTPQGTPVEVTLSESSSRATIEIVDHGTGIGADAARRVFQPFERIDEARGGDQGGSGLGLSVVAAIVTAHHGTVRVTDTPGGGATFRVELPLAPAS